MHLGEVIQCSGQNLPLRIWEMRFSLLLEQGLQVIHTTQQLNLNGMPLVP